MAILHLLFEEPVLNRRQRDFSADCPLLGLYLVATVVADDCREGGDGRMLEEITRRQLQTGAGGPGDDLDGEDGISTQLEEVVMDANLLHLQHACPYLSERLFD